jgi:hypothetical protein
MRHAHVNEVHDAGGASGLDARARRAEVDAPEFRGLRRVRVGDADELHERVGGSNVSGKGGGVERVAADRLATRRKARLGTGPHQGAHAMPPRDEPCCERTAHIARRLGNENVARAVHRTAMLRVPAFPNIEQR